MKVLIIGAGGHAQVVADILLRMNQAGTEITPIGFLDDNPVLAGQQFLDLPVLGCIADLTTVPHDSVVVAIGNNETRRQLFEELQDRGERFTIARHPSAIIAPDVPIGAGTMVCAAAVVNPGSAIGANVILNTNCSVDHHNRIADHVHVAPGVRLGGDVIIGTGALIGIGAIVMPRVQVGQWSMVSAGALVHRNLPDRVVAAGAPARAISKLAREG